MQKKNGLKKIRAVISLAMAVMLFVTMPSMEAFAAEEIITEAENVVTLEAKKVDVDLSKIPEISPYATTFKNMSFSGHFDDAGMHVTINLVMSKKSSVFGIKDIKIQRKVWYGWETVAICGGVEETDGISVGALVDYPGAVKGETYRVTCTFYGDSDGYREFPADSGECKYE